MHAPFHRTARLRVRLGYLAIPTTYAFASRVAAGPATACNRANCEAHWAKRWIRCDACGFEPNVGDVINLNRYRKRVQQQAGQQLADRNAVRHGRTNKERTKAKADAQRQREGLEAHRREPSSVPDHPGDADEIE